MPIHITENASHKALEILENNQNGLSDEQAEGFRLYLAGKSCDGFQYGICLADSLPQDQKLPFPGQAFFLLIDPDTRDFVENCHIDYVDDERGAGFLIENSDQKKFRGKFFKRKAWVEKLSSKQAEKTTHTPT